MERRIVFISLILWEGFITSGLSQSYLETRLKNVNGQHSSIIKEAGNSQLIVLDFWATWCKPCIKAIPKISELAEHYENKGVSFIGINTDSPRNLAKVKPFVKTHNIKYPVLLDVDQEIMNELLINAFPTLLILNREGKVLFTHRGFSNGDEKLIKSELEKLVGK